MHVYNNKGMKVPGMYQDGGALPRAFVGGAIKQVIKGVPKSLKRLFTLCSVDAFVPSILIAVIEPWWVRSLNTKLFLKLPG